ncbi:MAG: hypothetical protein GXO98_05690 [Nitrospirae bacterium]|nr:hypothetical protein [Nitrospirota bacterium]
MSLIPWSNRNDYYGWTLKIAHDTGSNRNRKKLKRRFLSEDVIKKAEAVFSPASAFFMA